jgi:hypothetical protein
MLVTLLLPTVLRAGAPCDGSGCEPSSYSHIHYLAPQLWRLYAHHQPKISLYAVDLEPGVPTTYTIRTFPCQYADPAVLYTQPNQKQ